MAKMIPPHGPKSNDSFTAEPIIYRALQKLSDDFTVIHSLPWLGSVAREITGNIAITGEIDFIILHPFLGILAIEVKGGRLRYDQGQFILKNGQKIDPITQVRKGIHTLARWIKGAGGPALRIGYAVAFPESSMQGRLIPPALVDMTQGKPENICIDRPLIARIDQRIEEIMQYWHKNGITWNIGKQKVDQVIQLICPIEDYSLTWKERIEEDNEKWLMLTNNQTRYLQRLSQQSRVLITGRSGTGKTLLATTRARQLASQGKRALFIVYNVQLAIIIKKDLAGTNVEVANFHQLCRKATSLLKKPIDTENGDWFQTEGPNNLREAINKRLLPSWDALIIDESQVFAHNWLMSLSIWFMGKPILACCDETQIFDYEHHSTAKDIARIIGVSEPFLLTENIRSPRSVFERLEALIPAPYTQQSPRPEESDTLQEIVDLDPQSRLIQTIEALHKEGIPPKSIMVIYFQTKPWFLSAETEKLVGQIISVYRCRGLESPIVLIWAEAGTDGNLLLCAYSRATSRCIAFYNLRSFIHDKNSEQLLPFYNTVYESTNLDQRINKMYPVEKSFDLIPVMSSSKDNIVLFWSPQWMGWVIKRARRETYQEGLICFLWIAQICMTSKYPIYVSHGLAPDTYMHVYQPVRELKKYNENKEDHEKSYHLRWCEKCVKWAPHTYKMRECIICKPQIPHEDINLFQVVASLSFGGKSTSEWTTIFMFILRQWEALDVEQQIRIYMNTSSTSIDIYTIGKFVSGLYILNAKIGENIDAQGVFEDSLKSCPWLNAHVNLQEWQKNINMSLSKWKDQGWVEKITKGKYKRKDLAVLVGRELEQFNRLITESQDEHEEYDEFSEHPF